MGCKERCLANPRVCFAPHAMGKSVVLLRNLTLVRRLAALARRTDANFAKYQDARALFLTRGRACICKERCLANPRVCFAPHASQVSSTLEEPDASQTASGPGAK